MIHWWSKFFAFGIKKPEEAAKIVEGVAKGGTKLAVSKTVGFFKFLQTPMILGIVGLLLVFMIVKKVFK
ncbi:hypothetical protein ES702_06835 [subsurface metagenome]